MRKCTKCSEEKDLTEFYLDRRSADGRQARCRKCYQIYNRARYQKDPVANSRWQRRYRIDRPERVFDQKLRRVYGITLKDFEALLAKQNHRCAICSATEPGGQGGWHVDHDHKSHAIRGLLCHTCNTGLGLLGDNLESLKRAEKYLENHANITPQTFSRKNRSV